MRIAIYAIMIMFIWLPSITGAETIYTWKDKDGVMRFSNEQPPEDVTDYEVTEGTIAPESTQKSEGQRRDSYDNMVQEAKAESDRLEAQRKEEAAAKEAEDKRKAEAEEKSRIDAERTRLEQEIDKVRNRAVSKTYPNGMKQAQIEALQKEIEKLTEGSETEGSK